MPCAANGAKHTNNADICWPIKDAEAKGVTLMHRPNVHNRPSKHRNHLHP